MLPTYSTAGRDKLVRPVKDYVLPRGRLTFSHAKIPANLPAQEIAEFGVPRNGRTSFVYWITPPGMLAAFANELAAPAAEVRQELTPLHAEM